MERSETPFVQRFSDLINSHLGEADYSIEDVCQELGVSRSQLFRLLKEQTGLSPTLYIRQLRLQKAKSLLDTTSLRIAEISELVGIDSPQNFIKYFSEAYGTTPKQYRKLQQSDSATPEASTPEEPTADATTESLSVYANPVLPEQTAPWWRSRWYIMAALVLIGLVAAATWWYATLPANKSSYSLAVMPFKNVGDQAIDYFCEGVADQIHHSLVSIDGLKVVSKNSSQLYTNTAKSTQVIGTELGVSHLINGTVWQLGDKVRITVQLTEVASDQAVWSKSYEGQTSDLFSFVGSIAKQVSAELNQSLISGQHDQLDRVPTRNLQAYSAYLQGKYLVSTRSKEKIEGSIQKFDEALALDPSFADAYAQKAGAYFTLGNLSHLSLDSSFQLTEQNALAAIRLDSQNDLAYALLACVYRDQYKWEQANMTYRIALRYNSSDAQTLYWYSLMLRSLGMLDRATQYSLKATELDPLSAVINSGHIRNCSHSNNDVLLNQALKRGELYFNNSFLFYWARAYHYLSKQRYQAALSDLQRGIQLNPQLKGLHAALAFTQARLGNRAATQRYLDTLARTPENMRFRVIAYAGLNDQENCLLTLEDMARRGEMPTDLKISPVFRFIHQQPRYQAILRRFRLLPPPELPLP